MEDVGDIVALWVHPFAKKLYFAFVIGVDTAEDIGKGGLAAAGGTNNDQKFVLINMKLDVFEDGQFFKIFCDVHI